MTKFIPQIRTAAGWLILAAVVLWAYSRPFSGLLHSWVDYVEYQHGFLVPLFAAVLLWVRRDMLGEATFEGSLWGIPLLGLSLAARWASAYWSLAKLDALSLLPCLAGIALLLGGWRVLRWAGPSIAFLVFMIPLPGAVGGLLSYPLQRVACITSTYAIQLVGIPAFAQGNVIHLPRTDLGVVDACSGLQMMMLFFAVCVGAAFIVRRSFAEKVFLVLSAIPIAVAANVARITLTAILYQTAGPALAQAVFHDLAGWLMMPIAVVMLWLLAGVLSLLRIFPMHPDSVGVLQRTIEEDERFDEDFFDEDHGLVSA